MIPFGMMDMGTESNVRWIIMRRHKGAFQYFVCVNPVDGKHVWTAEPHKAQTYITKSGAQYTVGNVGLADVIYASRTTAA